MAPLLARVWPPASGSKHIGDSVSAPLKWQRQFLGLLQRLVLKIMMTKRMQICLTNAEPLYPSFRKKVRTQKIAYLSKEVLPYFLLNYLLYF